MSRNEGVRVCGGASDEHSVRELKSTGRQDVWRLASDVMALRGSALDEFPLSIRVHPSRLNLSEGGNSAGGMWSLSSTYTTS